jgi:hypothetical protein
VETASYFDTCGSTGHCHKIQTFDTGSTLITNNLTSLKSVITYWSVVFNSLMPRFWYTGEVMARKLAETPQKKKKN